MVNKAQSVAFATSNPRSFLEYSSLQEAGYIHPQIGLSCPWRSFVFFSGGVPVVQCSALKEGEEHHQ